MQPSSSKGPNREPYPQRPISEPSFEPGFQITTTPAPEIALEQNKGPNRNPDGDASAEPGGDTVANVDRTLDASPNRGSVATDDCGIESALNQAKTPNRSPDPEKVAKDCVENDEEQEISPEERREINKEAIRKRVWDKLEQTDTVLWPRPCHGRIPNTAGSNLACSYLLELQMVRNAEVIKVHPSIGAATLRTALVMAGKTVLVPPYPGTDFLYYRVHEDLAPSTSALKKSGDKREYLKWGKPLRLDEIPTVDIVVVATCAISENGVRLGKGKGYGEIEWGVLSEIGAVNEKTPVLSICHEHQIIPADELPPSVLEEHDLPVDIFASQDELYFSAVPDHQLATCETYKWESRHLLKKPSGIFWNAITEETMEEIGALKHLKAMSESELTMLRNRHSYVRNAREASIDKDTMLAPNREYDMFLRESGMHPGRKEYVDIVEEAVTRFSDENILDSVGKKPSRGKNKSYRKQKDGSRDTLQPPSTGSGMNFSSSCGSLPRP